MDPKIATTTVERVLNGWIVTFEIDRQGFASSTPSVSVLVTDEQIPANHLGALPHVMAEAVQTWMRSLRQDQETNQETKPPQEEAPGRSSDRP